MVQALKGYQETNGNRLPTSIVVYRDSVGRGNFAKVEEFEIPQLEKAFQAFGPSYRPSLTWVDVSKRVGNRFATMRGANQYDNPPAGTVIDHSVTSPDKYPNFYLISQKAHIVSGLLQGPLEKWSKCIASVITLPCRGQCRRPTMWS